MAAVACLIPRGIGQRIPALPSVAGATMVIGRATPPWKDN